MWSEGMRCILGFGFALLSLVRQLDGVWIFVQWSMSRGGEGGRGGVEEGNSAVGIQVGRLGGHLAVLQGFILGCAGFTVRVRKNRFRKMDTSSLFFLTMSFPFSFSLSRSYWKIHTIHSGNLRVVLRVEAASMARTRTRTRELNVLITGFGPFMSVETNPSWLAVKPLHNTQLDLSTPPSLFSGSIVKEQKEEGGKVRIQTVQVPVHYGSVLDVVPRMYGSKPTSRGAKFWHDDRLDDGFGGVQGGVFPEGYPVQVPEEEGGWDVVIHVGVGRGGSLRCETQAHKAGYGKPDANGSLAPLVSTTAVGNVDRKHLDKDGCTRGFGNHDGYESFADVECNPIDVATLVAWLQDQGMSADEVEQSFDPGHYLCDFIYYCSLCEAKRRGQGTLVLFVHVPPAGQNLEVQRCSDAIRAIAWYMAKQRAQQLD